MARVGSKPRLSHAAAEFLARKRFAANTRRNYESLFSQFRKAIGDDIYLENVTSIHVDKYLRRYECGSSYNVRRGQLRTFFNWCNREGLCRNNPAANIDKAKVEHRGANVKQRIPLDEWPELLRIAGERHPLNRVLVALGLYLGQRGCELSAIKLSDLRRDEDGVIVGITVHRPKTHQVDEVPVFAELADEIEDWLDWYGNQCGDDFGNLPPNAYLVPARIRERKVVGGKFQTVSKNAKVDPFVRIVKPYKIIQQTLKDAGYYKKGEGAHTLRRSLAVGLFTADVEAGYSEALDNVKTMLGHQSVTTTEVYLGTTMGKDRLRKRVQRQRLTPKEAAVDNVVEFRRDHG